jgi:hypothetical protein
MIEQVFLRLSQILGLPDVSLVGAKKQVKIYLSSKQAGKWLLILNNVDNTDMWF